MKKKLLLFLIPLFILSSCKDNDKKDDGYEIEYKETTIDGESGLIVTSVSNKDVKEVIIPKNVDGFNLDVKFIDYNVFNNFYDLENVTLPQSITRIYGGCFRNCTSLKSIDVSNVIYIGEGAFLGCKSLKDITLNENLNIINDKTFSNCKSLTNINLGDNIEKISDYAFDSCESLTNITLPNNLNTIGIGAFKNCKSLKDISLPSSINTIDDYAFYNDESLDMIVLPTSLTKLGYKSFFNCYNLFSITNNSLISQTQYDKSGIGEYSHNNLVEVNDCVFTSLYGINYLVKYKGNDDTVTLPEYFNNGKYQISQYAFLNSNVKTINIPNTVSKIANYAFYNSKLDFINFEANNITLEANSFHNILGNVYKIDDGIRYLRSSDNDYKYVINSLKTKENVKINDSCEAILTNAFRGDTLIEDIKFGDNLKYIYSYAFYNATSLKNIKFNDKLEYLDKYMFYNCPLSKNVILSDNIKHMGSNAFYGNKNLEELRLSKNLESLDVGSIKNSDVLSHILIYNNIKTIYRTSLSLKGEAYIYYYGTKEEYNKINLLGNTESIFDNDDNIYFYSENVPTVEGKYFHIIDGKIKTW